MARLSAHPEPFAFLLHKGGLLAYCPDGVTLIKRPTVGWRVYRRKKQAVPVGEWRAAKERFVMQATVAEPWRGKCRRLPSQRKLEHMLYDGVATTPTGFRVEPDGHGPDGSPSWLLFFGYC